MRVEGTMRADNRAMRAVFRRTGYAKEGHCREAWPAPDGVRHDWLCGTTTPPDWDDEPF